MGWEIHSQNGLNSTLCSLLYTWRLHYPSSEYSLPLCVSQSAAATMGLAVNEADGEEERRLTRGTLRSRLWASLSKRIIKGATNLLESTLNTGLEFTLGNYL